MYENAEDTISRQLPLFAEASLASLTVQPGTEKARRTTATSGRNIAALLRRSDPVGCLLKMCLESERPYSTRCYLTWKIWRTPQGRLLFRLAPSTPRIGESGFSLWPTPRNCSAMAATLTKNNLRPERFPNLETKVARRDQSAIGGQLNPAWVCWLMGFPLDWLDVDGYQSPELDGLPQEYLTEPRSYEHSETPSSPKSQNGSGGRS